MTARACPLPIASISAWQLDDSERALAAGFRMHLAKPMAIGVLVDTVADLAGRPRSKPPRLYLVPGDE